MQAHRVLNVSILSAEDLKDVKHVGRMHTFAVVSMPPNVEFTTQVDKEGGVDPSWNETFTVAVPESHLQKKDAKMRVEIYTLTSTRGQRFVGEASIPLSDIIRAEEKGSKMEKQYRSYAVKTLDGSPQGEVHVAFLLGERIMLHAGDGAVWIGGDHRTPPPPQKPPSSSTISRDTFYPSTPDSETFPPQSTTSYPSRLYPEQSPYQEPPPYRPTSPARTQLTPTRPPVTIYPEPSTPYLPPPPKSQYPSQLPPSAPYYPPPSARPSLIDRPESPNSVFAGPVGRILMKELISDSSYDRGYRTNY